MTPRTKEQTKKAFTQMKARERGVPPLEVARRRYKPTSLAAGEASDAPITLLDTEDEGEAAVDVNANRKRTSSTSRSSKGSGAGSAEERPPTKRKRGKQVETIVEEEEQEDIFSAPLDIVAQDDSFTALPSGTDALSRSIPETAGSSVRCLNGFHLL